MRKLILLIFIPISLLAQINVKVDTTNMLIGDRIEFSVKANVIDSQSLPIFIDTISSFEIVSKSIVDSLKTDKGWQLSQSYFLTAWDSGYYYLPSIVIDDYRSDSIGIYVNTIQLAEDAELKDIKEPIHAPISFDEISPYLLALLILVLIIYLLRRYFKNKEKTILTPKVVEPLIPPYQIALNNLEKLNTKKLWQTGNIKEYYSDLSEIIRTYIEDGLGTPAMEIPTHDIIHQLHQKRIETSGLKELLIRADLAKFAKAKPLEIENKESLKIGLDFIHLTKPSNGQNDDVE